MTDARTTDPAPVDPTPIEKQDAIAALAALAVGPGHEAALQLRGPLQILLVEDQVADPLGVVPHHLGRIAQLLVNLPTGVRRVNNDIGDRVGRVIIARRGCAHRCRPSRSECAGC